MIVRPTRRQPTAHRPGRIVATLNDHDGRPIAQVYASTSHHKPAYRYRILGGSGEPMAASQAYTTETDAKRGFEDLARRLDTDDTYTAGWENAE